MACLGRYEGEADERDAAVWQASPRGAASTSFWTPSWF